MQGSNYQIDISPISNIPIPIVNSGLSKEIENLVDDWINTDETSEVELLERRMNELIFNLYNLTEEEKNIIRNN